MRPISVSNFVNSNIEYVEFWMMDPYADGKPLSTNPKLLLHLGNVSEDILKTDRCSMKTDFRHLRLRLLQPIQTGEQPKQPPVLYAFSSEGADRTAQDAGYDGLSSDQEAA
jgi:cell surface protein SprA